MPEILEITFSQITNQVYRGKGDFEASSEQMQIWMESSDGGDLLNSVIDAVKPMRHSDEKDEESGDESEDESDNERRHIIATKRAI